MGLMFRWVTLLAVAAALVPAAQAARSPLDVRCSPTGTFKPWVCAALEAGARSPRLGAALYLVGRDGAHRMGVRDEGLAACWGLAWSYELAWKLYAVPYFSAESVRVGQSALALHRTLPADHRRVCA